MNTESNTKCPEGSEYYGEDGLLYCGVCHEPKEARFPENKICFGRDRHPVQCACQRARNEAEQREREATTHEHTVRRLSDNCFVSPVMKQWTFENASVKNLRVRQAEKYVEQWAAAEKENCGLLFWGPVGTGKSFLAGCIANALLKKEVPVCMTNLAAVINHDFVGRQENIRRLCSYRLLILDDFGMERDTGFALETIYDVIDGRYLSGKPLIATTNLTLDELKNPKDLDRRRIYDRVLAMTTPVKFDGDNLRLPQRKDKLAWTKQIFDLADSGPGAE